MLFLLLKDEVLSMKKTKRKSVGWAIYFLCLSLFLFLSGYLNRHHHMLGLLVGFIWVLWFGGGMYIAAKKKLEGSDQ